MDLEQLKELNKDFAEETKQFNNEFIDLFKKWLENGNKRLAIINMVHLPLNGILNVIAEDKENVMCEVFPELPDMYVRFFMPFLKLKVLWGTIPNEKFVEEYSRLYQAQFDEWFSTEEERKQFREWFETQNKGS
jgi:hypothetical protein